MCRAIWLRLLPARDSSTSRLWLAAGAALLVTPVSARSRMKSDSARRAAFAWAWTAISSASVTRTGGSCALRFSWASFVGRAIPYLRQCYAAVRLS